MEAILHSRFPLPSYVYICVWLPKSYWYTTINETLEDTAASDLCFSAVNKQTIPTNEGIHS